MRPCRGRDAGSALALTAHTLLRGGPLPCTADPSRPAEAGRLVERLREPEGETVRGRDGAPSVRTPSLAIREGALGYRTPQLLPLLSAQWPPWRLPRARGQNTPPRTSPLGAVGGGCAGPAVGPCAARCLPRPAPPPFELGEGPAGPRRASRQVGGDRSVRAPRVRAVGPRGVVSLGAKGGKVLGARRPVGPGFPSPAAVVRESLSRPPSPHEPQPVAACGHGRGRLARERDPQDVEPRGGRLGSEDGSVEDGWRKMGLGGSPALAAGPGRGGPLWGWPGPVGVPGVSRDRPRVWVAVGPRAGFPGGPAVFPVSLWSPDGARGPVPRPPPCVLAGPSPPLPASPPRPARATAPRSLPLSGAEPASPHVGVVPPASVGRWRPRGGAARGEPCACGGRGGRRCAAGERSPWPACGSRVCVGGGGREPP